MLLQRRRSGRKRRHARAKDGEDVLLLDVVVDRELGDEAEPKTDQGGGGEGGCGFVLGGGGGVDGGVELVPCVAEVVVLDL